MHEDYSNSRARPVTFQCESEAWSDFPSDLLRLRFHGELPARIQESSSTVNVSLALTNEAGQFLEDQCYRIAIVCKISCNGRCISDASSTIAPNHNTCRCQLQLPSLGALKEAWDAGERSDDIRQGRGLSIIVTASAEVVTGEAQSRSHEVRVYGLSSSSIPCGPGACAASNGTSLASMPSLRCLRTFELGQAGKRDRFELSIIEEFGTGIGSHVWDSGIVLAELLVRLSCAFSWKGVRVLELGAGCGLTGWCAAALGADVTVSERDSHMGLLADNLRVEVNAGIMRAAGGSLRDTVLVWGQSAPVLGVSDNAHDVVLAADVLYSMGSLPALVQTLQAVCSPGTLVIVAQKQRGDAATTKAFLALIQSQEEAGGGGACRFEDPVKMVEAAGVQVWSFRAASRGVT